jgi:hypothetical protein
MLNRAIVLSTIMTNIMTGVRPCRILIVTRLGMAVGRAANLEAVVIMPNKRHGMSMNSRGLPGRDMASKDMVAMAMMATPVAEDGVAAGMANKHSHRLFYGLQLDSDPQFDDAFDGDFEILYSAA